MGLEEDLTLTHLAKIIERDSKDSTYKFALLRGTIDIIQSYPHYLEISGKWARYPMGLLLLRWIEYYYPLLSHNLFIPQKHGDSEDRTIAFRKEFLELIKLYPYSTDFYTFEYDLKKGIRDQKRIKISMNLLRKLRNTIKDKPMYHIGSSIDRRGTIYRYLQGPRSRNPANLNLEWIIDSFGAFEIPLDFHHVLRVVGTFISGSHSIIFKWAEFTSNLTNDKELSTSNLITLLSHRGSVRDVEQAKRFYQEILEKERLQCIWSGKPLSSRMHIDHLLPFSAIMNNDLWNLLPAREEVNIQKRDCIPTPELLEISSIKSRIIGTWEKLVDNQPDQFFQEIGVALLGRSKMDEKNWQNPCYNGLIQMSDYLINQRGLTPWKLKS